MDMSGETMTGEDSKGDAGDESVDEVGDLEAKAGLGGDAGGICTFLFFESAVPGTTDLRFKEDFVVRVRGI
jgi:hypothetical protein